MISITLAIVILTAIVSFTAFNNPKITNDLIFYPPAISQRNQWYRFISCALLHADIAHLLFNMWALYLFGEQLEYSFKELFGASGGVLYVAFYVITQFVCLLPTYAKHKDDYHYKSLGASGAVSAVVFASIFLFPLTPLSLIFLPFFQLPGFIFGALYLGITMYLARRGRDNINHSAHFWGAAAGIILLMILCYSLTDFDPVANFWVQVKSYFNF
jgi:membrane associated rhomboid family serine protease